MPKSIRDNIAYAASIAALRSIRASDGIQATYTFRDSTGITVWVQPGSEVIDPGQISSIDAEITNRDFNLPAAQAGLRAKISQKALTTNVATITTRKAHGFVTGQTVRIRLRTADTVFEGLYKIASVPSTTTFTYAKTNANVTAATAIGVVEAQIQSGDSLTIANEVYEIKQISADGLRSVYSLATERVQETNIGVS